MSLLTKKRIEAAQLRGVLDGSAAFVGPEVVHIDLTNRCNLDCIACWCRSPLLGDKGLTPEEGRATLPLETVLDLIEDLGDLGGTCLIKLGGGGEPFMHPQFKEIVTQIKRRGIAVDINTNFTLVDEETADWLVEVGVDLLTVSLWAATPVTYSRTHPNQPEATFDRIVARLRQVTSSRKRDKPQIRIHNVIMNLNWREVGAMLELGKSIGVDSIEWVLIDPVPGKTEGLVLDSGERLALIPELHEINRHIDPGNDTYRDPKTGRKTFLVGFDNLMRRLSENEAEAGIYDQTVAREIPCYAGWLFARILATGQIAPCCKGHRLSMGNLHQERFREIWRGSRYQTFRCNGLKLAKTAPYFSLMGNELSGETGCYNCDNLWQNQPMHEKVQNGPEHLSFLARLKGLLSGRF